MAGLQSFDSYRHLCSDALPNTLFRAASRRSTAFFQRSRLLLAACKTLARPNRRPLVLSPTSEFLPSRRLHQRKAGSAVAVISSEAGQPEKIALMPRVLVALASVGLRASSFTLATQRRQPNAFRRNMGALQSTAGTSVRHMRSRTARQPPRHRRLMVP